MYNDLCSRSLGCRHSALRDADAGDSGLDYRCMDLGRRRSMFYVKSREGKIRMRFSESDIPHTSRLE